MKTFREYFDEKYDFGPGSLQSEYIKTLGDSLFDYVDEEVIPEIRAEMGGGDNDSIA